jgi:hypothetical protein
MYGHGYYCWGSDVFTSNLAYGEKRKVDLVSSTTLWWIGENEDQLSTKQSYQRHIQCFCRFVLMF